MVVVGEVALGGEVRGGGGEVGGVCGHHGAVSVGDQLRVRGGLGLPLAVVEVGEEVTVGVAVGGVT